MSDVQLLAVRPWTSSLTPLSFHFFISRMGCLQTFPLVKCKYLLHGTAHNSSSGRRRSERESHRGRGETPGVVSGEGQGVQTAGRVGPGGRESRHLALTE